MQWSLHCAFAFAHGHPRVHVPAHVHGGDPPPSTEFLDSVGVNLGIRVRRNPDEGATCSVPLNVNRSGLFFCPSRLENAVVFAASLRAARTRSLLVRARRRASTHTVPLG